MLMRNLMLWCKGLFLLYGVNIDIEWCFDWKWDCVLFYFFDLIGCIILDVGCGSGYYMWCMIGVGVYFVVGIDFM